MHAPLRPVALVLGLLVCLSAARAEAGWLVEPSAGFHIGRFDYDDDPDEPLLGSSEGPIFGLRGGYEFLPGFTLALDTQYAIVTYKNDSPNEFTYESVNHLAIGVTVIGSIPLFPVRGWISYAFFNLYDQPRAGSNYLGSGFRFGLGWSFLPFCSLNVEYAISTFGERGIDGGPISTDSTASHSGITIGVSAPFSF